MYELTKVQAYLKDLSITNERIKECYNLIDDPKSRVNTNDRKWVACEQDHEVRTVVAAMDEILNEKYTTSAITTAVERTCNQFKDVTHKHRIPFYVLVIDKLI